MGYELRSEKLSDHLYRIIDPCNDCFYLALGSKKAALLDTGDGLCDVKGYIKKITDLPVTVILTHGHVDHVGGAGQFDEVWMNPKDNVIYSHNVDPKIRVTYCNEVMHTDKVKAEDLQSPYPLEKIHAIKDNMVFDLGGLHIQMIPASGHTPGIMCPLLVEERTIIFGDACGVFVMLMDQYSSSVSEYLNTLENLNKMADKYDKIYRNHGTFWSPLDLTNNVIDCCRSVLAHTDDHVPAEVHGRQGFLARKIDESTGRRADGKEGNLFYIEEKVK